MSAKENEAQQTEKVLTKYDLKMQKRAEEKRKDQRSVAIWKIVGVLCIAAIIGLALSFPVRRIMELNKTVVTIGDRKVGRIEFDYQYNIVKSNYMTNYGSYLSYYGLTEDGDPSTVMYSGSLTFKDYFEQLTVEQIEQNIALISEAEKNGFTYDTTSDWNEFVENVNKTAKENGVTASAYLKERFGEYASLKKIKPAFEEAVLANQYYQHVYDTTLPADSEIEEYYNENAADYDSVDYYLTTIEAELPTEPTEFADEGAEVGEDGSYTPSDAEKEAAMAKAKTLAEEAEAKVTEDGEAHTGELKSVVNYYIRDWLFEDGRKEGDTTVIENSYSNLYYVVGFTSRYLVEDKTADIRAIIIENEKVDGIVEEWNATDKSEESFITLAETYSLDTTVEGGLYKNQSPASYEGELGEWLASADRKTGDFATFPVGTSYSYIIYFLNAAEPQWKLDVTDAIMNTKMNEYCSSIVEGIEVKGDLNYIRVQEEEAAAALEAEQEDTSAEEASEEADTSADETTEEAEETESTTDGE